MSLSVPLSQTPSGLLSHYHHSVDELWCLRCEQRGGLLSASVPLSQASQGAARHSVELEGAGSPCGEGSVCALL